MSLLEYRQRVPGSSSRWVVVAALVSLACGGPEESYDLVIANGRVIDPESGFFQVANIGIELTDAHWGPIRFIREQQAESGPAFALGRKEAREHLLFDLIVHAAARVDDLEDQVHDLIQEFFEFLDRVQLAAHLVEDVEHLVAAFQRADIFLEPGRRLFPG